MTNNDKIMNKYSKYLFIKTFSRFRDYLVEKFLRLFQHSQSEETGGQVRETAATIRIGIDTKQLFHILQHNACKKELIIKKCFCFSEKLASNLLFPESQYKQLKKKPQQEEKR